MGTQGKEAYADKLRAEIERSLAEQDDLFMRIDQLRARIEGLEHALELYMENQPDEPAKNIAQPIRKRHRVRLPKSKFGFVLERIKLAGARGLTIAEMVEQCEAANVPIKRSSLRSQLFDRKQKGVLILQGGRYKLATKTTSNGSESTDSSESETPSGPNPSDTLGASFETGLAAQ